MIKLDVYISPDCWSCQETPRIIADVTALLPNVAVEIINIAEMNNPPEAIFAVPTYLINGRVVSLGNPTPEELLHKIDLLFA